jgi:hypothetical protein
VNITPKGYRFEEKSDLRFLTANPDTYWEADKIILVPDELLIEDFLTYGAKYTDVEYCLPGEKVWNSGGIFCKYGKIHIYSSHRDFLRSSVYWLHAIDIYKATVRLWDKESPEFTVQNLRDRHPLRIRNLKTSEGVKKDFSSIRGEDSKKFYETTNFGDETRSLYYYLEMSTNEERHYDHNLVLQKSGQVYVRLDSIEADLAEMRNCGFDFYLNVVSEPFNKMILISPLDPDQLTESDLDPNSTTPKKNIIQRSIHLPINNPFMTTQLEVMVVSKVNQKFERYVIGRAELLNYDVVYANSNLENSLQIQYLLDFKDIYDKEAERGNISWANRSKMLARMKADLGSGKDEFIDRDRKSHHGHCVCSWKNSSHWSSFMETPYTPMHHEGMLKKQGIGNMTKELRVAIYRAKR